MTIGEEAVVWKPDTISVSEAVALIKEKDAKDHFVYGVVMGAPFITYQSFNGHASFWLADLENANDTIELYDGYGLNNAKWASLDEAKNTIHEGDTVLVYAGSLVAYTNKAGITFNEISGGYYAAMLGANPDAQQETDPTVTPELPEGVISCADAVAAAASIADATAENATVKGDVVKIRGYVTYAYSASNGKQSAWIDDKKGGSGLLQGAYLQISEAVAKDDYVEIEGTLAKYYRSKQADVIVEVVDGTMAKVAADGTVTPVDPTPVQLDTISVAKALEIGYGLLDNAVTEKQYVIEGYVSSIESYFDSQFKNETFWIADEEGSTAASNADGAFYVYRGKPDTEKEIGWGAKVYATVTITKFSRECKEPVIENSKSAAVTVVEQGEEETIESISVAKALEIGNNLAPDQVTKSRYEITGYVSSIDVPYSEQYKNETFWITDAANERTSDKTKAFYVYRGKPASEKEIGYGAKIKILCKIKNFKGSTIENDGMGIAFEVLEEGEAPVIDTITTVEAIEIGMALENNAYSEDIYVVAGYAIKAYAPDSCKTSQNVYMSNDPYAKMGDFYAYSCSPDNLIKDGDYFCVIGKIQKYVGSSKTTIEISNAAATHMEAPKVQRITVPEALEIGNALAPGKKTVERYEVVGYVASILEEYDEGVQSFIMTEEATATTGSFYINYANIAAPGAVAHNYVGVVGFIEKDDDQYILITNGQATINPAEGIEHININAPKAQKVLMDGVIYIVRDGKIFNLQGAQVR
ncbi:MAG: hypothetical protein IJ249_06285 [Paludibacteraceae bacterium]|nr:hypothetical protein [Paludibacteraceae bacterium]